MAFARAYEEIADFIAGGTNPQSVVDYRPSEDTRKRVAELLARETAGEISPDEASELQGYLQLEHLMRLAKARARRLLRSAGSGLEPYKGLGD